ncbi:MAG: ABC transporter permease, partial [Flavobacteriaceae bacterium]|nr:ABC transporter permease [Flavobacteriaceae bacterium]
MKLYFRIIGESFGFALSALTNNKLRTLLSLLGVTIGIFSIIAILSAVDSLDKKVRSSLDELDQKTVYVFKYKFGPSDVPNWKQQQFPNVTYEEYQYLKRFLPNTEAVSYQLFFSAQQAKYENKTVQNVGVNPVTDDFYKIKALKLEHGRFFNTAESESGASVVVIGHEIAQELFGNTYPVGKQIRMFGQKLTVIGVIEKEGESFVNFGYPNDSSVYLPVKFLLKFYNIQNRFLQPIIVIKPKQDAELKEFAATTEGYLRRKRGIKPGDINNFFVNTLEGTSELIDQMTGNLNLMGGIISFFSLLVGGFGIANIMFVSVKERTNLIGIQKSLGAKNHFILLQYIFEAVALSMIGGLVGVILVFALIN